MGVAEIRTTPAEMRAVIARAEGVVARMAPWTTKGTGAMGAVKNEVMNMEERARLVLEGRDANQRMLGEPVRVGIGGREYAVGPLSLRKSREAQRLLAGTASKLKALSEDAKRAGVELDESAQLDLVAELVDSLLRLSEEIAADWGYIEEHGTQAEVMYAYTLMRSMVINPLGGRAAWERSVEQAGLLTTALTAGLSGGLGKPG